ncbi:MAG: domain containing protein [Crocinitomicaceae bacterium]|nr:domain containing protein [Crocinitomicaceae bacterium]
MKIQLPKIFSAFFFAFLCIFFVQNNLFSQCQAEAGADLFICPAGSVQLGWTPTASGGTAPYTYAWTPAAFLSCTDCANPTSTTATTRTYTVTVTDDNGCVATDNVTVTAAPNPTSSFTFSGGNNQCANLPIQFTNTSTGGATYSWNFGDPGSGASNTSTLQHPTHIFTAVGTATQNFTVTLTTTSPAGCTATSTQTVTVRQTPGPDLVDPMTSFRNCGNGATFSLEVFDNSGTAGNSNFQIIWGDGTGDFTAPTFPGAGVSHTYSTEGVFDLIYAITGSNGCRDSTIIPVASTSNPSIGLISLGNTVGCAPLEICIQITGIAGNHNTTTYLVDYGDGSAVDTFSHPPPAQICHTYLESSCPLPGQAYTFSIEAVNLCSSTLATVGGIRITAPPIADLNVTPTSLCVNTTATMFNNTDLGYNGACSRFTNFLWDFGDGQTQTVNSATATGVTHVYTTPGIYEVVLSTSNSCGTTTDTALVCVEAAPVPDFNLNPASSCVPFNVTTDDLSSTVDICAVTRNWSTTFDQATCNPASGSRNFINGTNAQTVEPQFAFNSPGIYSVHLTLSNSCGNITHTEQVVAQAPPEIAINAVSSICGGQNINPTAVYNDCQESINTYQWDFPGASTTSSTNPVPGFITYPTNGSYTITLTATNGCGSDVATTGLTVNNVPPALNPITVSPLCAGYDAEFFSDTVVGATYNWSGPNGFSSNQQNPVIPNASAADEGTYTVFASFGSCSGVTQSVDLVVLPITVVNAGPNVSNCVDDDPYTITAITPAGGTWSGPGISAAGLFDPAAAGAGVHTLTYTFVDPGTSCIYSDDILATVNALPVVNAGADVSLCNQPIANTLTPVTPPNGVWSGTGITDPDGEFTPSGTGSFEIHYSFTDGNGCFNEDTIIVTVIDPTNADAGDDSTVCENGANVQLTGLPAGGTWSGAGITPGGVYDPTVPGTFTMTYSFGSGTCQTSDVMDFIVNPAPVVDAGNDFTICFDGGTVDLSANPNLTGGTWTGNGITNPNGTFDPQVAGNGAHTLTYTYTDPVTNCSNTDDVIANVNPLPVVNAGNDTTLCNQPLPVQFNGLPAGGTWSGPNVTAGGVFTPSGVGTFTLYYGFTLSSCSATDSMVVTVVDPSQANAGSDLEMCFSNTMTQLTGLPAGGTWTGPGIAGNGNYTPNNPGTYEMVYSFGGGNCLTRDTMELIVHALPIVDAGDDVEFCESEPAFNFIGTPSGGSWSGNGITNATFGTFDPSVTPIGANTITYTYTDPVTQCVNTDDVIATIRPLPTVMFDFSPIICEGNPESFTNNTLLGDTYDWDFGDNTAINHNVSPIHTYSSTGFFDIQLVATTVFGCVDSLTQTIEVREPPIANFIVLPDSACGPLTANFTNTSTGIGALVFSWDFGNGASSASQNPGSQTYTAGVIADTTYYITLDVTNFCGTVSKTDSVKVMPDPTAIFGPAFDEGCSPFTVDFANISVGLPDTYSWDFGNGTTSNTEDSLFSRIFITGLEDTTFTIRLIVTNECGADTAFHDIHVLPTSVNSFFNTNITEGCAPLTVDFTSISAGAEQFNWNFDDGNVSNTAQTSNTFTDAGTYNVRLIVNDACSRDTSFATITVHPQPDIDFTFTPNSQCVGLPFEFTNQSTDVSSLSWDFDDGSNSALSNPTHIFTQSGVYNVTLSGVSSLFACQASVTHPVTVASTPVADFSITAGDGCIPATTSFTNSSTNFNFVSWDFGDNNFSGLSSPSHIYTEPGVYTVQLMVENNIGCKDSMEQLVQVFPVPTANFDVLSIDTCHLPSQAFFGNTSSGAISYNWNFGNSATSTLTNPSVFYDAPGTYFIKLVATNQYGCSDSLIRDVTIFQPPAANFVVSDMVMCVGESFTGTSISSQADSVRWFMGDGNTLSGNVVFYEYEDPGDYFVTVVAYGDGGCSDTMFAAQPITINVTPIANFNYINVEEEDLVNGTIDLINMSAYAHSYLWRLEGDSTSTAVNPRYQFDHFGNEVITLIATNENGCVDSISRIITVDYYKGLHVANAMNPGHPDFEVSHFIPKGVGLYSYRLTIYDDWGNLLWETTALDGYGRPTEGWDGTYKGAPVQQDAYVWKIEATFMTSDQWDGKQYPDGRFKRAGTVTVIR